jgi:8-oxo-dGTP pyrophosphatase MutT (NUDIX family)
VFHFDQLIQQNLPSPAHWRPTTRKRAAVLCPIVEHGERDHLLFVMRPLSTQSHPGQIAFPGGMQQGTETPLQTAIRECTEEVGAPAAAITPLGELSPRESTSKIHVQCIVARIGEFTLKPDPREVARVLHMPLTDLLDNSRWQEKPPPIPTDSLQPSMSPHFQFGDDLLWGLTARFTRELLDLLSRDF